MLFFWIHERALLDLAARFHTMHRTNPGDETIPLPRDGLDKERIIFIVPKRLSNLSYSLNQYILGDKEILPDYIEQFSFRNRFAGSFNEVLQYLKRLCSEPDPLRCLVQRMLLNIECEGFKGEHRGRRACGRLIEIGRLASLGHGFRRLTMLNPSNFGVFRCFSAPFSGHLRPKRDTLSAQHENGFPVNRLRRMRAGGEPDKLDFIKITKK